MKNYLLLIIAMFIMGTTFGQLSGIKNIPGSGGENDYATIAAAITALNSGGVGAGGVTFNVAADYTEAITTPLLVTATGTLANPIVFQKSGSGANPKVTRTDAGTLATTSLGAQGDAVIIIQGSDYITFDGIDVAATSVSAPAGVGVEYGYYLRKAGVTDGCKYVTIKNAAITMAKGTSAFVAGIYSSNNDAASLVNSSSGITVTSTGGRNENVTITGNTISNVFSGIVLRGFNHTTSPYDFYDQNYTIGASGEGNTIQNYAGNAVASAYGVYLIYHNNATVSYNTINNTAGGGSNFTSTGYGIFHSTATNGNGTYNNNTITLASTTGQLRAIMSGTSSSIATLTANSNTISLSQAGTSDASCIYFQSVIAGSTLTANNNRFSYGTFASTTTSYLMFLSNAASNITVTGNKTTGTITKTGAGTLYGYYNNGSPTGGTATITGNNFSNITLTGASVFYGFSHTATISQTLAINNDTISNITGGTSAIYGIYATLCNTGSTIDNNRIYNLTTATGGSGAVYGVYLGTATAPSISVSNNHIYGLSTAGTGAIYGIDNVQGLSNNIYKNRIYNLSSSNASAIIYGIYFVGGTLANAYNNYISDLRAPAATGANAIGGIYIGGGTTVNLYYNTVYLNATGGATFGSTGIYKSSTTNCDLRNNNIVNVSTPGTTSGLTVAFRWSGVYNATYYNALSGNNNFYAGLVPAANKLIFYDGTNSDQTIGAYQSRVTPRDQLSFSELPPFVNVASTPYDLHISTALPLTATKCESGGTIVSTPLALTDDFDGNARYNNSGYPNDPGYPASNPDVGADEFAGKPLFTCAQPVVGNTVASANAICLGQSITLSLQNATAGTGIAYRWQSSADGITYNNINGAVLSTYTVSPTESIYYQCIVACNNEPLTSDTSAPVQITFANTVSSTTPATRCGTGTVELEASASSGTIKWYAAASGGASIGNGSPWTTPSISTTTTYYAGAETNFPGTITLGAGASTSTGYQGPFYYSYGGEKSQYLIKGSELASAGLVAGDLTSLALDVTQTGAAFSTFTLSVGNTALNDLTSTLQTGLTAVYNAPTITPAVGIFTITFTTPFTWDGSSNIIVEFCWSNTNGGGTPHGYVKYDATTFVATAYHRADNVAPAALCAVTAGYGVYSSRPKMIIVGTSGCSSPRMPVIATVTPAPAITPTATPSTICQGDNSILNVTSPNADYTYLWTPGNLNGAEQSVFPTSTQVYSVTATDVSAGPNAGCVNTGTVTVNVNPVPTAIVITPSAPMVPANTIQSLAVSGGILGGAYTFGTGALTTAGNSTGSDLGPNPMQNYYGGTKQQMIFTAAELTSGGMIAGLITSLKIDLPACDPSYSLLDFTVKMGHTATSAYATTSSWITSGLTMVRNSAAYTPQVGLNTISLNTPFNWDGISNLIVEMSYSNNNGGNISTVNTAKYTATTFNSTLFYRVDSNPFATIDAYTGAASYLMMMRTDITFDNSQTTTVTWSPFRYLYTDASALVPYSGAPATTVYTKPDSTLTYTATATTGLNCTSTKTVVVTSCPATPGSPATSNIAATSFDLNWSSSQGSHVAPLTYTIEVATENTFTAPIFGTYQTTDPVVTQSVTGLTANTQYFYRIRATGDCDSPWTTTASVNTCPGAPGTPSTASINASSFILNWSAPTGGTASALTYTVEVATDALFANPAPGSPFSVSGPVVTQSVSGLAGNTTYYYRVAATGSCIGEYTAVDQVSTCPAVPGTPTVSNLSGTAFDLTWSVPAGGSASALTYTLEVSTNIGFTGHIAGSPFTMNAPTVTKSLTGLTANTKYYYRVKATGSCVGDYTTVSNVNTCPGTPGTPSTASITYNSFILNWSAPAGGAAAAITYSVDIATNSTFTTGLTTVSTSNLTYTFSSLTGNTKYYYRVKSTNGTCPDNYTATGNVTTCPAAPVLSTPVSTSSTAQLNWLSSAGGSGTTLNYTIDAGTNINFLVGLLPGSPFTVADPTTTLALNTLQANTTYYYRIKAIGAGTCNSSFSTVGTVVTCPGTPVGLAASNLASTSFDLSWTAASGGTASAIQYTIDVTTDPGFSTPVAGSPFTLNHPVVSLHVGGLTGNTPYYYRVKATGSCASNYVDGMTTTLACFEPVDLTAVSTSSSTVYISWSAPIIAPPFGYEYEVYTTIGNTLVASGTVNPGLFVSLTGLTPMTSYSVKLRSVCDGGTYSQWENTTVTTTNCSVASIPYLETFDTYTPPNYGCLTVEDVNQDVITWYTSSGPSHSGTKKMTILTSDPPEVMNDWLFTKGLSLEAGRSYKVNFWYRAVSSSFAEKMEVKWGYGPISGLMTSTAIFTNAGFSNASYTLGTATFTVPTTGAFWIGWHCFSDPQKAGIYLDDISVCELPDVPGTITGPALVCKPQTNQSYSIPPIADATSYVWSVPSGASIIGAANSNTIMVNYPAGSLSGNVTVYGVNDCGIGVTSTLAIDIYPQMPASVSISGTFSTVCEGESITFTAVPVNGGENPSYEWKVNGQTIGSGSNTLIYVPFDNDVVECVLTSDYICAITNPATSNELPITVIPQLVVGSVSSDQTICENHVPELLVAVDPLTGNTPSYQWQVSADGETFSDISGATEKDYQPGNLSVSTWYRQVQNALVTCSGPLPTNAVKITVIPTVGTPTAITIADGMDPVCQLTNGTTTTTYATTATTNTGFNWTLSDNNAGTITSAGVMTWADGYAGVVDIQVTANGCNGPSAMVTYQVDITPTVGLPTEIVVSAGTEPSCQLINETTTTTYSTTATNNTGFNWTISNPLAGSINPTSGVMTWTNGFFGSVDIQVTADGCNGPSEQTSRNVVITETVGIPVFADGASSVRCQGAGNVLYAAVATTTTGITYSLDLVSSGAGVAINPNTGEVTYTAAWSGTTVITASAAGCNGPALATHSAATTETVGTPTTITIAAGTEPVCQIINETTTTTYATTATTNTGFNWSISNNAAGNINSSGVMTWTNGFSGTVDIQVTANGCNGPSAQTIRTVTITPTVGTPTAITILAGVDPACQLINETTTTTYATTVTNGTGFNWTISNPLAGNIGAATGIMSWANGFTGSVDIQVTANGCNGPSAMISHSVTVNPTVGLPAAITVADGVEPACQLTNGTTTTTYATTASNSTSYTWSLSNPAAGIIGASTGVITWADGFAGTVDIQVVAQGCNGPSAMTVRTVVVNPNLPVSVSIERSTNNVCAGTLVTFTATPVNPGDSPVYQWKRNGVNIGSNNTMFTFAPANEDVITCELTSNAICATGSPAISNTLTMSINPVLPVSVTVSANNNPSCAGNQVTFTALAVNGGLTPVYQWRVNGSVVGTDSDTYTYLPVTGDVVRCMVTSSETCVSGNPATSAPLTMTVNPMLPVSVSIVTSANNVCAGTQVTLTATPVNGGTLPAYQWFVNTVDIAGATNATYTYAPSNTDLVTCVLTSSILCGSNNPATSNTVAMVVNPVSPVSITIVPSANPSCAGSSVTFTATPVNGGSSPAYQWRVNDIRRGTNSPVYTYVPANNDVVTCRLTSNQVCATGSPAISNAVAMTVSQYAPASVSIATTSEIVCVGEQVTLTATPVNGGTSPSYQWKLGSGNIDGATNATYTYTPANNDAISCIMTSNFACATGNPATSNTIVITVNPLLPVSVSVLASENPSTIGNPVTFTATGVNEGSAPVYQWFVNGTEAGLNSNIYIYTPSDGDMIYCIMTSNDACISGNPATSNTINMTVVPEMVSLNDIIVHNLETVCYNAANTITVAGNNTTFQVENGGSATMIAGQKIVFLEGTIVYPGGYLHGYISNQFCGSMPAPIMAVVAGKDENPVAVDYPAFKIYPNPTSGNFTLEQKGNFDYPNVKVEVYGMRGERILTEEIIGQMRHEFVFSNVPAGLYFVKIITGDYIETIKLVKSR